MSLDAADLCKQLNIEIENDDAVETFQKFFENLIKVDKETHESLNDFFAQIDAIYGRKSDEDKTVPEQLARIVNLIKYYKKHDDKKAFAMHLVKILIPALILMIVALAATAYGLVKVRNYQ